MLARERSAESNRPFRHLALVALLALLPHSDQTKSAHRWTSPTRATRSTQTARRDLHTVHSWRCRRDSECLHSFEDLGGRRHVKDEKLDVRCRRKAPEKSECANRRIGRYKYWHDRPKRAAVIVRSQRSHASRKQRNLGLRGTDRQKRSSSSNEYARRKTHEDTWKRGAVGAKPKGICCRRIFCQLLPYASGENPSRQAAAFSRSS